MNSQLIGKQIQKFRKASGLTQKELGNAIGVSTQAVSQWECGGTPDVMLLPAIADRLGVTIDALFGREGGETTNISDTARRWLWSIPPGQRIEQLCRLIWELSKATADDIPSMPNLDYLKTAGGDCLLMSVVGLQEGLILDCAGEDITFMSVWPEPTAGYAAYFADNETYRRLFAVLARPKCLELMEYLGSVKSNCYAVETVAGKLETPAEEIRALMQELEALEYLEKVEVELESGTTDTYFVRSPWMLAPFLYISRCLIEKERKYLMWVDRKTPWLRQDNNLPKANERNANKPDTDGQNSNEQKEKKE